MLFTFPRPTNELMDKACAERLVQVIKMTERQPLRGCFWNHRVLVECVIPFLRGRTSAGKPFSIEVICITVLHPCYIHMVII